MEGSDEEKTANKTDEKQEDAEKDFEDIQLDIDTDVAKYSHEKESPIPRENGKHPENVITDQPIDATPPPSYANDVTVHGLDPPVVRQGPLKPKPKDFVVTSCFVILCCNFIFGLLGYHFGVKANHAWQLGDEHSSRKRAKLAMIFVILGIIAGISTYVLALTLYFTLNKDEPVSYHHSNTQAG